MKLKAIYNSIIVKPIELENENYTGRIIVPDMGNDKNKFGKVIDVGEGHISYNGNFIPTLLKKDDIVILPTMGFTLLQFEGEEYWVGPENQCLGKLIKE